MKKLFALLLCFCMMLSLAACGGSGETEGTSSADASSGAVTSSDSALSSGTEDSSDEGGEETVTAVPNKVMACDQQTGRIIVYDLDQLDPGDSLDLAEEWSFNCGYAAGLKYREDTVFGDVVLVAGSPSRIVSYPEGENLWSTSNSGNNPHSIEILPSGNIVIANSTGGTLRFFYTSALLNGGDKKSAEKFFEVELTGAHGVLWDPEYDVLWAVGDYEIAAYRVLGEGTEQTLSKVGGMGATFPEKKTGGHDLAADLTDTRYLYATVNSTVFRFDKEENVLEEKFPQYGKLGKSAVKGFGNNQNGNFFFCYPNGGPGTEWEGESKADWCTDRIYFAYWKTENLLYVQEYVSDTAAFYKCRVFYGQYQ